MNNVMKLQGWHMALLVVGCLLCSGSAWSVDSGDLEAKGHPKSHVNELDCSECHTCDLPTRQNPCLADCPRHMGHFHTDQRPDDGPSIVIIDELANLYDPVPFAHELHATMSDMVGGCENCHHYSEPGGAIPPCSECHDPKKGPLNLKKPSLKGAYHRQCMSCHLDWSHENACSFCHTEHHDGIAEAELDTTDIVGVKHPMISATDSYYYDTTYEKGPIVTFHHNDHVDQFGLNCVDCHRGESCSSCHDQLTPHPNRVENMTACTACHEERGCKFCHDYERKPAFEHGASTGWALGPRHSKLACTECHGTPKEFHTPKTSCIACHTGWEDGDFDHAITGVVFDEDHEGMDCSDCHMDNNFEVKPTCDECHDDDRSYNPKTGFGG